MKKFLRMGVLRGGRLVDDRYVSEKGEVSVGSSVRNTVGLVGARLPESHVLVSFHQKQPVLHVVDGMTGELALDGAKPEPLDRWKAKGERDGSGWSLELTDEARGWVALGDVTFFLQVGPKPPPPPKRALPKEARAGFIGGLETAFVGILVAVTAVQLAGLAYVHQLPDAPLDHVAPEDLDRFAEIIMPEKPKDEPKKQEEEKKVADDEAKKRAEEEARKKAEDERKKAEESKKDEPADPKAAAEKKAQLREAVSKKGVLNVLGSAGGAGGALANVFSQSSGFTDDVGAALAGASGVLVATGAEGPQRKDGGGSGGTVGIGDLGSTVTGGGGKAAQLTEKAKTVVPQISFDSDDLAIEGTTLDKDALNRFIRQRAKAIQACYEKELKRNPSLKGKIVVRLVITPAGRVGEASIDQNSMGDREVEACILRTVRTWSFPFRPEEEEAASFPFVFSPGG